MSALRAVVTHVIFVGLLAVGMTAVPSVAAAVSDPVVEESGDTITYTDPALAGERTTTVEGTLRAAFIDRLDRSARPVAEKVYAIVTDDGEAVPIDVDEDLPDEAANGAIEAEVVDDGSDESQVSSATVETEPALPLLSGTVHRAYVVKVGKTGGFAETDAQIANRLEANVLDEWVDESEGKISEFTVEDVVTLSASKPASFSKTDLCRMTGASTSQLWDEGKALFPGVDFGPDGSPNHLIMLNSYSGCASVGNVGVGIGSIGRNIDDGGLSTILWDSRYLDATGIHELGHNFSLSHANTAGFEYYNIYSVMGFGIANALAPALDSSFRDLLGITESGEIARPSSGSTTYTLSARGLGSGVRGLEIVDPASGQTYWVDYRTSAGRDSGAKFVTGPVLVLPGSSAGFSYAPGVVVYQAATARGTRHTINVLKREAGLVDATSYSTGQAFTSPSGRVKVTVLSRTEQVAEVRVSVNNSFTSAGTPSISGTARVGQTLTAHEGTFTPEPATSFQYQWYWDGSKQIPGATSKTFTIAPGYAGHRLRVRVIGEREGYQSRGAFSGDSATVGLAAMSSTRPRISGEVRVGNTLRAVVGSYSPARPTKWVFQWYAGANKIPGARWSKYTVTRAYEGQRLRVRVMGYRSGYEPNKAISVFSTPAARQGTFSASAPKISGTLQVGHVVTAREGSTSPTPTSYRYQWYWKGSRKIPGATSRSFKITPGYAGQKIRVQVTAVRGGYVSASRISGDWARVSYGRMSATRPTITGEPIVGNTVRVKVGFYNRRPTSWRFQWYAGAQKIPGARWSKYTVTSAYEGQKLRIRVIGYRPGYAPKQNISIFSAPVTR